MKVYAWEERVVTKSIVSKFVGSESGKERRRKPYVDDCVAYCCRKGVSGVTMCKI